MSSKGPKSTIFTTWIQDSGNHRLRLFQGGLGKGHFEWMVARGSNWTISIRIQYFKGHSHGVLPGALQVSGTIDQGPPGGLSWSTSGTLVDEPLEGGDHPGGGAHDPWRWISQLSGGCSSSAIRSLVEGQKCLKVQIHAFGWTYIPLSCSWWLVLAIISRYRQGSQLHRWVWGALAQWRSMRASQRNCLLHPSTQESANLERTSQAFVAWISNFDCLKIN